MKDTHEKSGKRRGHCLIVLHTHLPYVHHPDYEDFLEEEWLFEAICETYLPLLSVFSKLQDEGLPFRLAMSWTPPLLTMLRTPQLAQKFENFIDKRIRLAAALLKRPDDTSHTQATALHYHERLQHLRNLWASIDGDIPEAFADLQRSGHIEILASSATHGFLPLFAEEEAQRVQIELGMSMAEEVFGERPTGFWLPECAWDASLGSPLRDAGVRWVVLDHHGVVGADPRPAADHFRPLEVDEHLFAFGRDPACSEQVWSSEVGYPGDPAYRELYRDVGYDADYRFIRPFLNPDGIRRNVGLKFHRVTGKVPLHDKELYDREAAMDAVARHAADFLETRGRQIREVAERFHVAPIVTAPYDTELFGHWWYEGPEFIDALFRAAATRADSLPFDFTTPGDIVRAQGPRTRGFAYPCTWGRNGFAEVWLSERNAWIWPHLFEMQKRMVDRATEFSGTAPSESQERILNQMGRELLLAESSDWPFIITMDTSVHYAERRFRDHVHRFFALEDALDGSPWNEEELARVERDDAVFPNLDFRHYART